MKHIFIATINYFDFNRISNILKQNKIDFYIKSSFDSCLQSGWMNPGSSFNEKMLFVDRSKQSAARQVLKEYLDDHCV